MAYKQLQQFKEAESCLESAVEIIENEFPQPGEYLGERDIPAARKVLKAAAFTYIASAMMSLLDVMRWLRLLRI